MNASLKVLAAVAFAGFLVVLVIAGNSTPVAHQVTWYQNGQITATGDAFDPSQLTCAVRNKSEIGRWIRFEYEGSVVICWANDRMPSRSTAEYDLTPAAFMRLAPLKDGRLYHVKVRVVE